MAEALHSGWRRKASTEVEGERDREGEERGKREEAKALRVLALNRGGEAWCEVREVACSVEARTDTNGVGAGTRQDAEAGATGGNGRGEGRRIQCARQR